MTAKKAGKMAKQLAGSGTGQSLMDRVTQAKFSLAGSELGKVVAKSSTEELIAPKKKHLDSLTKCSNEPNVSIPLLVNFVVERMHEKSWVVVFKSLITAHHLINYGNEKITQYLASNNCDVSLSHFNDKTSSQSYEMSLFIRKYSKYLSEKKNSYQLMAFDFCKVKRGKDDGVMRTMPADKLLKALPCLRTQLNVAFEFEATEKDLNNHIINAAFLLLYKDIIRLFASYNEGMMNLVEKYFSMKREECEIALELYIDFSNVMKKIDEFLTVAESMGIGDKNSMGLLVVPEEVVEAMQQHLSLLERKKKPSGQQKNDEVEEDREPAKLFTATTARTRPPPPSSPVKPIKLSPIRTSGISNTDLLMDFNVSDETTNIELNQATTETCSRPTEVIITNPEGGEEVMINDEVTGHEKKQEKNETKNETKNEETIIIQTEHEDEEGISLELQQQIIAVANTHFVDSAQKTSQVVKESFDLLSSHSTRSSRADVGNTTARSQTPSPSRPPRPRSQSPCFQRERSSNRASPVSTVSNQEEEIVVSTCKTVENEDTPVIAPITPGPGVDDLFGLDFISVDDELIATSSVAIIPTMNSISDNQTNKNMTQKPSTALSELMSLDPLLGPQTTSQFATPLQLNDNGLPAGLKPTPANVVLRPLRTPDVAKKSAFDQLDSTLANLASSLGSNQPEWGSSSKKK